MRKIILTLVGVFAIFTVMAHTGCKSVTFNVDSNGFIIHETDEGFYTKEGFFPWHQLPAEIEK